jgi:hypothetical protein
MKNVKVLVLLISLALLSSAKDRFDKPFNYFLKSIPTSDYTTRDTVIAPSKALRLNSTNTLNDTSVVALTTIDAYWVFKPEIVIPMLYLQKSLAESSLVDINLFTGTGGGITYQRNELRNGVNYATFSVAAALFLTKSGSYTNATPSIMCGCLNNVIMLGVGYNLGKCDCNERRTIVLLSIGINLTN